LKVCFDARGAFLFKNTGIGVYTNQILKGINLDYTNDYLVLIPIAFFNNKVVLELRERKGFKIKFVEENVDINQILIEEKIDVFHIPDNGVSYTGQKVCKIIVTVHDLIPYVLPNYVSDEYLKKFMLNVPKAIYDADIILTVSECSKNDIKKFFKVDSKKIKVTYLASRYTNDIYLNEEESKIEFRKKLKGDYILYVGGFNKRKNVVSLLSAYKQVLKKLDNIKLILVGKYSLKRHEYLVKMINELEIADRVTIVTNATDQEMDLLYKHAKIFVYPSLYEGFGLPNIEAMSQGVPVITYDNSAISEVVCDAAVLCHNDKELEVEMLGMLMNENKRKKYIIRGKLQSERFSFKKTVEHTIKAYNDLDCN